MQSLSERASWWMTAACFAWVWGLLSVAWPDRYALSLALAVAFGASMWVATRWPWPGVVLTAGGLIALGLLGIGTEDPAPVGPLFLVLVVVGYLARPRWSWLAVPILYLATAIPAQWDLPSLVFGALVLFLPWWFGVRVRVRDGERQVAADDAHRLVAVDEAAAARLAAASEREDIAASGLEVIGRAVGQMTLSAASAQVSLDPREIALIHRKGEEATARLRTLLVLLREEPVVAPSVTADVLPEAGEEFSWRSLLLGGWPAGLLLLDVLVSPFVMAALRGVEVDLPQPGLILLVVLPLMAALVLRDRWPVVAPLVAALALTIGSVVGVAEVSRDGLWLMITVVALSWSAGQAGTRASLAAWFVFTMTVGALVYLDTPYYLPIYLALEALPFGAAAVWSGHHDEEAAHRGLALARQREIETAEQDAISRERLLVARDLHDAASHAVGTMMMQANAAAVLRERDPQAARNALGAVVDTGRGAWAELREITAPAVPSLLVSSPPVAASLVQASGHEPFGGPTSGGAASGGSASGGAASGGSAPLDQGRWLGGSGGLEEAITPLVAAARHAGCRVILAIDLRVDASSADVVLIARVVREGLANAVRHAPGSEVTVEVSALPARVLVVVANGPARRIPGQDGGVRDQIGQGLGLRGLRELIGERGGELAAGPAGLGFELRVTFAPGASNAVVTR